MTATAVAPLRIGVIGAGRIGRLHAELLARRVPGAALGPVYDVFAEAARELGGQFGAPVARSVEEVLEGDADAVAICSTAASHAELMIAAARGGKAIFCEKPVSLELSELDAALAVVEESGVPFQVGFNRRFDPAHASVRDAVVTGVIGEPHLVRISSRDPEPPGLEYVRTSGGLFLDMTIHDFDMARFLTGSEVVEVFARAAVRVEPAFADAGDVDTAVITLVHENGCLTAIDNSRRAAYGYDQRVEVFGSAGMAASENPPAHSGLVRTAAATTGAPLPWFFLERYRDSYERAWQAFVAAVRSGTPPAPSLGDARAPLVIGLAAGRSAREDRPVAVAEIDGAMKAERLTVAQALVRFLAAQEVERDGVRGRFFAGCLGIFGHGNVAGLGQALAQYADRLPYHPARNEQSMVHVATGFARQRNRLATFACTSSVGPGATNMVTGAALATVNRLPVLLLPGDTFATRRPHPVLQQLEVPADATVSVNDCFRPVSRFYERVERPEQLFEAALGAMRVLVDPAETGAVTLALPEDVQAEALEVPASFMAPRVWTIDRQPPAPAALARAVRVIAAAQRPLIVAGGGVIYSEALEALRELVDATGIPVAETQAGRGALISDHPLSLGAVGATGTAAANRLARVADVIIGIGTRWADFTTASKSAFQDPEVRFVNVNVAGFDAAKLSGLPLLGDARVVLDELRGALRDWHADEAWQRRAREESVAWGEEVTRLVSGAGDGALASQASVIGAINDAAGETGVVVCAAGSAPGDLHKLWRARDPAGKGYHVEYGYSCMGYEIPAAIGVKLAAPEREVIAFVGDGSFLMSPGELVTAVAEEVAITIVLVENHGYASIGALSRSVGGAGFGTHYRYALNGGPALDEEGVVRADALPVDLAATAESLGAQVIRARSVEDLRAGLTAAREARGPTVVFIETDRYAGVPSYDGWWDVPVAEVSEQDSVRSARLEYERARSAQRTHLETADE